MKYNQISLEDFLGDFQSQINPSQSQIKIFKEHLATLHKTDPEESEEHHKNEINDFLKNTFAYKINTRNKIDAAIYEDNRAQVIIEVKALKNKTEFPKTPDSLESKAFYESILYYLRELWTERNNNIKHIILCNLHSFYIIDAKEFHKCFANDKEIDKFFKNVDKKEGNDTTTDKFYEEIRQYLPNLDKEISYTCFELTNIQDQDIALIYAVLSPTFLLKRKSYIDANTLNQGFYDELLYILGLCEKTESGKIIIVPSDTQNTFLHSITQNLGFDKEKDFEEIFSLLTIWNNRILFLRLLESMLLSFGHIKKPFLDLETIADFKVFNQLFFDVLAREEDSRTEIPRGLEDIPYLNSSLFEKTPLESENGKNKQIKSLDSKPLKLYKTSILKQNSQYKDKDSLPLLEYLFAFLHSYDFTTTPKDIENHTKMNFDKLINSAVLGLVFEKLNGYKEGSFYTPSFITSYMCRQSITKVVIDKFNTIKKWDCKTLDELYNKIEDIGEANQIFHSITICDPAVGSGHFLVSALNELIYIKYKLGILCDTQGLKLKDITLELINDEMVIRDSNGDIYSYTIPAHQEIETHKIQKAMFYTKKNIIENCLFGVDINPNSCEITRLRLWIELLKYSYYKDIANKRLETLPNIDINIKAGNSLISNFPIDTKLTIGLTNEFTRNLKTAIEEYKIQANLYKEALRDKELITDKISSIKTMLKNHFIKWDKRTQSLEKSVREFVGKYGDDIFKREQKVGDSIFALGIRKIIDDSFFDEKGNPKSNAIKFQGGKDQELNDLKPKNTPDELDKEGQKLLEFIRSDFNYLESLRTSDSFEWRFEFPEVLDENGDFIGFDLVIGNPPYIDYRRISDEIKEHLERKSYSYNFSKTTSIFVYFIEISKFLISHGGNIIFINPISYISLHSGKGIRNFIDKNLTLISILDISDLKVFESASTYTCINYFRNKLQIEKNKDFSILFGHATNKNLEGIKYKKIETRNIENLSLYLDPITEKIFNINCKKLSNFCEIFCGLSVAGFRKDVDNIKTKENFPFLEASDILRYNYRQKNFLNRVSFYYSKNRARIFKDQETIFMSRMTNTIRCCIPPKGFFGGKINVIYNFKIDRRFILGVLNSKLMNYFYTKKYFSTHMQGGAFSFDTLSVGDLPIPKIEPKNQKIVDGIILLVDQILKLKKQDLEVDISTLENDIDILVYKLYNLTDEDIKLIEKE